MRQKKLLISLFIAALFLSISYITFKPTFKYLSGYLSKSEQVNANILIVEGWLPDFVIKKAYEEFRKNGYDYIITTGLKSNSDYFELSENGYLIFYLKNKLSGINAPGPHSIEIDAYSELEGENRAHFNLFVNDSVAAEFYAGKPKNKYGITWNGNLNKLDSILVHFNNDDKGDFGDRNLYVKEVIIDHKIKIPYQYNSEFDDSKLDGKRRIINNYNSNAEFIRNKLLSMGIDSSKVIATSGKRVMVNRTLSSALAFRNWLKTSNITIKGINIISMGPHARRTWMTYDKILDKKFKIGIISIPDYKNDGSKISEVIKTLRETIGIFYYWLILIPY